MTRTPPGARRIAPTPADSGDAGRLQAVHDRLTAAVADLTGEAGWQQLLRTAARFPRYSPNNLLLIATQKPEASAVAGFHTWRQLGRQVRKGEKGIAILAPVVHRAAADRPAGGPDEPGVRAAPGGDEPAPAGARRVTGFRVAYVFDVSQTDGQELPAPPAPHLLTGQAPAGFYDGLAQHVRDEGFQLLRQRIEARHPGQQTKAPNGLTDYVARTVLVADHLADAQASKTLAHELGHVLLHPPRLRGPGWSEDRGEVEAESVAYVVSASHGLDSAPYSVPYVTGWAGGDLSVLRQTADRVLTAVHDILLRTPPPATFPLPGGADRGRQLAGVHRGDPGREQTRLTSPALLPPAREPELGRGPATQTTRSW